MDLDKQIESMKEELISAVQDCIRIKSVKDVAHAAPGAPFGPGIQDALEWTLELGKKLGFSVKNVDGYAGHIEMGAGELLGILGHLDVVPEGDGWSVPPFSAEIVDGKIYGRGALDDKGPSLAALFAMKAVKDAKIPLKKRVRLILGTDEESGWADMDYYLKKEEVPNIGFAPDAEFPLIHAEKGILHLELKKAFKESLPHLVSIRGGERANVVPDICEVTLRGFDHEFIAQSINTGTFPEGVSAQLKDQVDSQDLILAFKGIGAHGSLPQNGKNAVLYALNYLLQLPLSPEEQNILEFILKHPGRGFFGEGFGIAFSDEPSGQLSLNLGIFELSSDGVRFVLDIRYPVTYKQEDVLQPIETIIQAEGFTLDVINHQKAHHVPKDSELVKSLLKAYADVTGLEPYAFAIGGGTYAKALPRGVAFGPVFPGEPEVIHCADEYISIDNLILTTKVYAQAIVNIGNLENH
ncbi:dipeptidase, putative [Desulfosporosinus acidiphilus SJ4]|uniref:Dipeptidase, putative n=1 Tax=Desulfosporosinus acidiphilus (strain DSM 22704 / JCM 16185 / SJ4) TaxID=646529 RepID=I4D7S7_DESAJ|nr:dipeptidase PepV [Desulfosporosinus acidiphilus]AFM41851.1 dipeptidase, putative [Desulfosporosinus acidiphilus SJ4]